jgi:hypothetical protein
MLLAALAGAAVAHAGACCVGSTTTVPARVGECETVVAGVGVAVEHGAHRWDSGGTLARSSLTEDAVVTTLAAGWGWDRKGQVNLSAPMLTQWRRAGDLTSSATGAGDLRVTALWDPLNEEPRSNGRIAPPVPVFTVGLRAPTGRSWAASTDPLMADVTGLHGPAAILGAQLERTLDKTPWSVGVFEELGATDHGLHPTTRAFGTLGRTLGRDLSLVATAQHIRTSDGEGPAATRTSGGLRATVGRRMRWRAWAGVDQDLPLAGLGRDNALLTRAGVGALVVR